MGRRPIVQSILRAFAAPLGDPALHQAFWHDRCIRGAVDRDLTPEEHRARRRVAVVKGGLLVVLIGACGWTGQHFLSPSVSRSDLLIEVVERGPLEATVTASGTVVPRHQQTVSSPAGAPVRAVLVSLGERVERGKVLMQLDTTASELELHNLEERLALSQATLRSQQLQLEDSIRQARSQRELRAIDLESRLARLARLEPLVEVGATSKAELVEAQLDVKRTRVELAQLDAELLSLQARRRAELDRLERESAILEAQRADQSRRIEMSSVKAPIDGIVTTIAPRAGSVIAEGAVLATIAAQDSFSVEAAVSEFYAPQLKPGQRVRVRASTNELSGHLSRILPAEDASRLMLFIELDDPATPKLYANLRVDVDVVVAEKPDVLQVRRGPGLESSIGSQQVYVISGNRAFRKPVRFGLSGPQQIEIVAGLHLGDRLIVSDMQSWQGLSQIRIR
jgi:HlyD family secretion protein